MLKVVIFDLDGTLINSVKFWLDLYKRVVKKYKVKIDEKELIKRFGERDVYILISLMPKEKRKDIIDHYHKLKIKKLKKEYPKKFRFTESTLKKIKKKGIKVAIATGNPKKVTEILLNKNGLKKYVDFSVSSDEVKRGKPFPDMLLKIIKHFKVKKKEVICVGDSAFDFEAARKAKVKVGLVKTGVLTEEEIKKLKPNFVFNNIRDVLKII